MGVLVIKHLLLLTTGPAALLTTKLLSRLTRRGLALVLALENLLGEHPPRQPAVFLARAGLTDSDLNATRLMDKPYYRRGLVRLLSPGTSPENERLLEIVFEDRGLVHQLLYLFYLIWAHSG